MKFQNNLCFPLLSSKSVSMKASKRDWRKIVSKLMTKWQRFCRTTPATQGLGKYQRAEWGVNSDRAKKTTLLDCLNEGYTQFSHKRESLPNCREFMKLNLCKMSFTVACALIEMEWCPCFYLSLFPFILIGNLDTGLCNFCVHLYTNINTK